MKLKLPIMNGGACFNDNTFEAMELFFLHLEQKNESFSKVSGAAIDYIMVINSCLIVPT
jgi:hypothetical protein